MGLMTRLTRSRDFLEENRDATVYAVDQYDSFPRACPRNLIPEIDNIDREWVYPPNKFDFIHCRQVPWLQNMGTMLQESFRCVKPGGWTEISYLLPKPEEGTAWGKWTTLCAEIRSKTGRAFDHSYEVADMMKTAGFEGVRVESVFFCAGKYSEYDVKGLIVLPLRTVLQWSDGDIDKLAKEMEKEVHSTWFIW